MLANIVLHSVLDTWFESEVKPRLRGRAELVRFADDFVVAFEREEDAGRVHEVLPKRFEKHGLTLHPDKRASYRFEGRRTRKTTTERRKDRDRARLTCSASRSTGRAPSEGTG